MKCLEGFDEGLLSPVCHPVAIGVKLGEESKDHVHMLFIQFLECSL